MDTITSIGNSQPTKKSSISLRELIDIDETGGVIANAVTADGAINHNQILTAYAEKIDSNGTFGKVKIFRFKNLVSLMSGGTGISVSTNTSNVTTITNTGVTSIIAGTGITVSSATGDVTIDSTGGGDMYTSTYDTDLDGVVDQAECVKIVVRNSTGVTLTKGQVVYLSGATGNRPNAVLADASTEATSSKTIGLVSADILNNTDGYVTISGTMHDLDLSAFAAGDRLWLKNAPGAMVATTPPAEPNHSVFIGTVARAHPTQGRIVLAIQNGYELDELHGVLVPTPSNNDVLVYENATSLWKNKSIATILGYTPGTGNGTVTSVAALTLGTTGTDLNSTVATGTTTPVITLNVPTASASNRGALSSTDWSTFNSKQSALTLTTTGTTGAATLVGATLNIPQYAGPGFTMAGNLNGGTIAVGTTYCGIGVGTTNTSETTRRAVVATGTVTYFYLRTVGVMTGSLAITLMKNGVATAMTFTIAAASAAALYSTTSNTFTVADGDELSIRLVQSTATSIGIASYGFIIK